MNRVTLTAAALAAALSTASGTLATTATSLSDFEGIEEPTTRYYPASGTWVRNDTFANITNPSSGSFRFELRYHNNGEWFDCDDDASHRDRGRAEVKGLGVHQRKGETYDYIMNMRTGPNWKSATSFAHVFQLFTVNNTSSVGYMVQMNLSGSTNQGKLTANARSAGTNTTARTFSFTPGTYATYRIQVKGAADGHVRLSINGDALTGVSSDMTVGSTYTGYRPKWGLYRSMRAGMGLVDNYVEMTNVQANNVVAPASYTWEAENLSYTTSGETATEDADTSASAGSRVNFRANGVGDWIEFNLPTVAPGTYQVRLQYKSHTSRGISTFRLDGATLGGSVDQYAATSTYPNVTIGTVTFTGSGTHKLRLTVSGKNSSSTGYYLSADKISLVGQ